MMQRNIHRMIGLLALWMLCSIGAVHAGSQVEAPAAWRTTPRLSADVTPAYEFRSTSACTPVVGTTSYNATYVFTTPPAGPNRARREWDEEPTDEEIGFIDTPVGEPFILLLLALLMSFVIYIKKRATS